MLISLPVKYKLIKRLVNLRVDLKKLNLTYFHELYRCKIFQ